MGLLGWAWGFWYAIPGAIRNYQQQGQEQNQSTTQPASKPKNKKNIACYQREREGGREQKIQRIKPEQDIEMQSARQQQNDEIRPCFCNLHKRRK